MFLAGFDVASRTTRLAATIPPTRWKRVGDAVITTHRRRRRQRDDPMVIGFSVLRFRGHRHRPSNFGLQNR
jgi:hypothetical protein